MGTKKYGTRMESDKIKLSKSTLNIKGISFVIKAPTSTEKNDVYRVKSHDVHLQYILLVALTSLSQKGKHLLLNLSHFHLG